VFPFLQAAGDPDAPAPTGLAHGGDWANYRSLMVLVPERELGVALLVNKNHLTHGDLYDNIGWNTALLALDLEADIQPPALEFLPQYGRWLGVTAVVLLAAGAALSLQRLSRPGGAAFWIVQLLLDLVLAGCLLFVILPQTDTTLPLTLAFEPDIGLIYVLVLALTLGWGPLRTFLALRRRSAAAPSRA
jgi:hypothetical protein